MRAMQLINGFSMIYGEPSIHSSYNVLVDKGGGFLMLNPSSLSKELSVLKDIVENTVRLWKFYEEYSGLLQEYISPEDYELAMSEFRERTGRYENSVKVMSEEEIARRAKLLLTLTGAELSSDEIAEMLNVDVFSVESALNRYSRNKAAESDERSSWFCVSVP